MSHEQTYYNTCGDFLHEYDVSIVSVRDEIEKQNHINKFKKKYIPIKDKCGILIIKCKNEWLVYWFSYGDKFEEKKIDSHHKQLLAELLKPDKKRDRKKIFLILPFSVRAI